MVEVTIIVVTVPPRTRKLGFRRNDWRCPTLRAERRGLAASRCGRAENAFRGWLPRVECILGRGLADRVLAKCDSCASSGLPVELESNETFSTRRMKLCSVICSGSSAATRREIWLIYGSRLAADVEAGNASCSNCTEYARAPARPRARKSG
jgi:hypothetical protein